jgi:hypothetical protein
MITREQAKKVADAILEKPRADLKAAQEMRRVAARSRRRRRVYVAPVLAGLWTAYLAGKYLIDDAVVAVALGIGVGLLLNWAARRR